MADAAFGLTVPKYLPFQITLLYLNCLFHTKSVGVHNHSVTSTNEIHGKVIHTRVSTVRCTDIRRIGAGDNDEFVP